MKIMRNPVQFCALALLLAACGPTYHGGVELKSPISSTSDVSDKRQLSKADSLQPTFTWKPAATNDAKYDLIVYKGVQTAVRSENPLYINQVFYYVPGTQVYYRQGLDGQSHQIEQPLDPDTVYVWAVRTRNGSEVGEWSVYDTHGNRNDRNMWCAFLTPN